MDIKKIQACLALLQNSIQEYKNLDIEPGILDIPDKAISLIEMVLPEIEKISIIGSDQLEILEEIYNTKIRSSFYALKQIAIDNHLEFYVGNNDAMELLGKDVAEHNYNQSLINILAKTLQEIGFEVFFECLCNDPDETEETTKH